MKSSSFTNPGVGQSLNDFDGTFLSIISHHPQCSGDLDLLDKYCFLFTHLCSRILCPLINDQFNDHVGVGVVETFRD